MYMLIMVLDNVAHREEVLASWERAGIRGVTILESTGLHRVLLRHRPDVAYSGFGRFFGNTESGHNTLFAVVESMTVIEAAVAATEHIVGKLDGPNTGIMFALPISRVWGMPGNPNTAKEGRES